MTFKGCAGAALSGLSLFMAASMWAEGHPGTAAILLLLPVVGGIGSLVQRSRRRAEWRRVRTLQSTEIVRYHAMNPRQFELAIAFLCERDGCQNARVVGGANDLGADVVANAPDGRLVIIQCKRYGPTTKVGSPDMQRFGGTCFSIHRADVAAVVTTSAFTKPAFEYGVRQGIRLFGQDDLAAWATRTGPAPWMT